MSVQGASVGEVSLLLREWSEGDQKALDRLTPIVYQELHRLAGRFMRGERAGDTLQPTALVNEAYLRLVDYKRMQWQDRAHFFAVAAQVMRRILVERARRRNLKRGGGIPHISFNEDALSRPEADLDLVALDDALNSLFQIDARKVRIIEMRFFAGLSVEESAEVLHLAPITVKREWRAARAWLHRELSGMADHGR